MSIEAEVLTFKQRGGKSLKDAWYRINDAQNRSTKKQATTVLLRNFYVGVTNWYRYILDTLMGGNFLGAHTLEAPNVIESLVGNPPIDEIKIDITLEHVLNRLDTIEVNIINIQKQNELDKKLIEHVDKLDGAIKNISKRVKVIETIKAN